MQQLCKMLLNQASVASSPTPVFALAPIIAFSADFVAAD
jgi:hypothetical protein